MTENVIIYDQSKGMYWGNNREGYAWAHSAGVYTREEAQRIADGCKGDRKLEFFPPPEDHIPTLKAKLAAANAALQRIHEGACRTAVDSRSRDDDRYCIAEVMRIAGEALNG